MDNSSHTSDYTKGPWKVEHCEQGCPVILSAKDEIIGEEGFWGTNNQKGNSQLVAAAPDMLEALESVFKEFGPDEIGHYDVMEKVVNAINKARE